MSFDTGFNINDLVREENKEEHSQEWRNDPNRIKAFIKKSAAAQGIVLKNPEPNCKRCHGRGWIGVDAKTGIPVVCKCIFFKEDLDNEPIPEEMLKPKNRAERRKRK
jgi:hypothetical protein